MDSQFETKFMEDFGKLFSVKKWKQVEKLTPLVGRMAAIALVGNERTSRDEIAVLAKFLTRFKPFTLYSYKTSPNKAVLAGRAEQGNLVLIFPQYRIQKPEHITRPNRTEYWYVDFAIKIFSRKCEDICIGLWGGEYDGHPQHLVESGVTRSHFRDVIMENAVNMRPVHITKSYWLTNSQDYIDNITLKIDRLNAITEHLSEASLYEVCGDAYESPELDVVGEGKMKLAVSWELLENN